jgi:succinoglycan biosynthesis protein ExoO
VLDADDKMYPGRLKAMMQAGDAENADIIVDNLKRVRKSGAPIEAKSFLDASEYTRQHQIGLETYIYQNMMMSNAPALGYLKPMFKAETLRRLGLQYDISLRNSEDYFIVADLLAQGGKMLFVPITGYAYQVEQGSISHRLTTELTSQLINAGRAFEQRYADSMTPEEAQAANAYTRRIEACHVFQSTLERLKSKQYCDYVRTLFSRPSAIPFLMSQYWRSLLEKANLL